MDKNGHSPKSHELPGNKPLLRAEEVANFLDLSKSTVFRLIKQGELPARRFGNSIRIRREDVLEYANNTSAYSHVIEE